MEETLGKRICAARKRLGLTQDALAERLGVTAQAVSKWANDLSCPDITMLPRLAQIFGTSVDTLLGIAPSPGEPVHTAEVVTEPEEDGNDGMNWEFHYESGRKPRVWFALWVLLVGVLLLARSMLELNVTVWGLIFPSALLVFGLYGLYPNFSFFRLGCTVFGVYSLLSVLEVPIPLLDRSFLPPVLILILGISMLADALKKPRHRRMSLHRNGKIQGMPARHCTVEGNEFDCSLSFGEESWNLQMEQLRSGSISVSFAEATVDLSGCRTLAPHAEIDADCAFGELTIQVPRRFRAEVNPSSSFASVNTCGQPDDTPEGTVYIDANASFGEINVVYI